ncbi:AAA family ATPase [Burkholderia stagnalis]|uniref:ATP-dependent nuclease n=1 Tax=Burkholderia stagnalis TaxID=1503054 RepID=UPI0009BC9400|nr:AAA family ATPase [Burkholderia stagnalis]RQQ13729.1 AAA family ATPase [Burkholderia stagnalis]RQQ15159.1 AAA family ATPase [Burkholderia stagnalis]RQR00816.1 AAA family ATPase [Burkholderia stagnalis]RQX92789.1 AAA family ATPase [Burkholderia stagnalis]RQY22492.1 AAA family ATPase [Burkholderia stagnalis]
MSYQSEIRHSTIGALREKVQNRNYSKYLLRVLIERARSFSGQSVTFDFPVTALIGPNGGGKTTLLGAAACAYGAVKPSRFFAKSGRFDASMQNWKFDYEFIDKSLKVNEVVRRSAKFTNQKWSRDAAAREVAIFGVSRTVPANERPELIKCISSTFDVAPDKIEEMSKDTATAVAKILDKDVSRFSFIAVRARGLITLLAGSTSSGDKYSEFHFGAGESSIIRMVSRLETIEENALVLIEEIENGLHPLATIRLVEYLIDLADRRKIQVIFTTHSNDALKPLPDKAIWSAVNGRTYQGKLDIASLRAISGQVESQLVIFVEDKFSKSWVAEILRSIPDVAMDAIEVHHMEGDNNAARIHRDHNMDPSAKQKSICIVDGDSRVSENPNELIFKLPGEMPESFIFNRICEKYESVAGEMPLALLRPYEEFERVRNVIFSVNNTNRDPHLLYAQVGRMLGFINPDRVKEGFLSVWSRHCLDDAATLISAISDLIPKNGRNSNKSPILEQCPITAITKPEIEEPSTPEQVKRKRKSIDNPTPDLFGDLPCQDS